MREPIHILGGGLAGTEAAWQVARRGARAVLYEMRPGRPTPAHQTGALAELVCSNSLKSESESTAPWLLKEELRRLDSLLLRAADASRVPGGHALTVDRVAFADEVSRAVEGSALIEVRRESTFLRYSANAESLQDLLTFLYAECCTRNKAVKPESIVRICK